MLILLNSGTKISHIRIMVLWKKWSCDVIYNKFILLFLAYPTEDKYPNFCRQHGNLHYKVLHRCHFLFLKCWCNVSGPTAAELRVQDCFLSETFHVHTSALINLYLIWYPLCRIHDTIPPACHRSINVASNIAYINAGLVGSDKIRRSSVSADET